MMPQQPPPPPPQGPTQGGYVPPGPGLGGGPLPPRPVWPKWAERYGLIGLCLAAASLVTCGLTAVPALAFGVLAIRKKVGTEKLMGYAAVAVGAIGFLLFAGSFVRLFSHRVVPQEADMKAQMEKMQEIMNEPLDPAASAAKAEAAKATAANEKAANDARQQNEMANAPVMYPTACTGVDPKTHVPVDGASSLCVPQGEGVLIASLLAQKSDLVLALPSRPSGYDDEDQIAVFLGPDRSVGEESKLSAGERAGVAAKTRAKTFAELKSTGSWGEWSWVESAGKLTGVIDLGGARLTDGEPWVQRKQKCETQNMPHCGGRCDDDSDCMKIFSGCGCPESTCNPVFRFCSDCPSVHTCDDPEFPLTVPKRTFHAVFSKADDRARAKRAAEGSYGVLLTRLTGAWRRTFTKTEAASPGEKPERKVEFDSGYYARIAPLGFFVLGCGDEHCGKTAEQLVSFEAAPWSVTIGGDPKVVVRCTRGLCDAKATP